MLCSGANVGIVGLFHVDHLHIIPMEFRIRIEYASKLLYAKREAMQDFFMIHYNIQMVGIIGSNVLKRGSCNLHWPKLGIELFRWHFSTKEMKMKKKVLNDRR